MVGMAGAASLYLHLSLCIIFLVLLCPFVWTQCDRNPVIFMFGDSNSDTGGLSDGLGFTIGPPNARAFFHSATGRICDGRLIIDFLCESLNTRYLTPYLESLAPNFTNGANFAISGSSTLPKNVAFSLNVQILQFIRFQARSIELTSNGFKDFLGQEDFKKAQYVIDIGQNDIAAAFTYLSYAQVIEKIQSFIAEINNAIWELYKHGGKNFWVHNTGPLGCLPQKLATTSNTSGDIDQSGCIKSMNDAAKVFNEALRELCVGLRYGMKDATIVYVDMYSIKYDIIANAGIYGFASPSMVCCGNGGPPYNFNPSITCGVPGFEVCEEGSRYISWDGVHYTEASNEIVASKILSTNYSTPPIKFNQFCNGS